MESKDYYAILNVERKATLSTIKQAYRQLARRLHPDVNPNHEAAAEHFKLINEAYEVLSNPTQRRQYDRYGPHWKTPYPGNNFSRNSSRDDFEELEFGRFGSFEDLLGDLLDRYG